VFLFDLGGPKGFVQHGWKAFLPVNLSGE